MSYAVETSPPGPLSEGEGENCSHPLRGGAGGGVCRGGVSVAAKKFNCVTPKYYIIIFSLRSLRSLREIVSLKDRRDCQSSLINLLSFSVISENCSKVSGRDSISKCCN